MKKENCECCCGKEEVKMYFCPKCKSTKVKPVQGWRNAFGIIPKWKCDSCGFENMTFPIMVMSGMPPNVRIPEHPKNPTNKHKGVFLMNKTKLKKRKR